MSNTKTEAEAVAQLAHPVTTLTRGDLLAINNNLQVVDAEEYANGRNRARGAYKTSDFLGFKSFIECNNSHKVAPVFIDHNNISAEAILNYVETDFAQGHCDHTATLKLEPTVIWTKLNSLHNNSTRFSQRDFAVFLEDWSDRLTAKSASDEVIPAREAIHAVRNMDINATATTNNTVTNTSESRSLMEQVEAKSATTLPAYFEIKDQCYLGLDERDITLRLIINTNDGKPTFGVQVVKFELVKDEIIQNFKQKVIDLLPDYPVRIGTFKA